MRFNTKDLYLKRVAIAKKMGKATLFCYPNVKSGPMGNRCAFDNGFFPTNRYGFTKWPLLYFDLFFGFGKVDHLVDGSHSC